MKPTQEKNSNDIDRRRVLAMSAAAMVSTAAAANTATAQSENETEEESGNQTSEETTTEDSETNSTEEETDNDTDEDTTTEESESDTSSDEDSSDEDSGASEEDSSETTCDGAPSMSRTSITTPSSRITSEDPAVVEANFRPDPTIPEDCTIMVDLEFSFANSGFQWEGGSDWDQSASDFVVGTFEVGAGEIRSIQGELHTQGAESGDQVTVQADYELWFEGNREDSRQQSGIRQTIDVEAANPPEDEGQDVEVSADASPGFGVASALAGIGGAGYVLKSKLGGDEE